MQLALRLSREDEESQRISELQNVANMIVEKGTPETLKRVLLLKWNEFWLWKWVQFFPKEFGDSLGAVNTKCDELVRSFGLFMIF